MKPFWFAFEAEKAHHLALTALRYAPKWCFPKVVGQCVKTMGLTFPHPVGLAAGLDKNGEYLNALAKLGFSFIEVGTVTPRPQSGNAKPRLFRLPEAQAVINRMGFNNQGVDALVAHVKQARYRGILGINIGKNKDTSLHQAVDDYLHCLKKVYCHASYVAINISSPNTPDLRQLQQEDYFFNLVNGLREEQLHLSDIHQRYVPLVVKVSPDESEDSLKRMAEVMLNVGIDGIIATNTTGHHEAVSTLLHGNETGGLSGRPLASRALACLRWLKEVVGDDLTLIGVGGIDNAESAIERVKAGATLMKVYTGLIYRGGGLVGELVEGCADKALF